jgi:hypothetical protein
MTPLAPAGKDQFPIIQPEGETPSRVTIDLMTLTPLDEARLKVLRDARPDSYIALNEDETQVVGEGDTMMEAWEQAKKNGFEEPMVWWIPKHWGRRILCLE